MSKAANTKTAMSSLVAGKRRLRKSFGRIPEVTEMPNLIEVQKSSYV